MWLCVLQNYLPSQEGMVHSQFIKMMIIFSVAFFTVLILKVSDPAPRLRERAAVAALWLRVRDGSVGLYAPLPC